MIHTRYGGSGLGLFICKSRCGASSLADLQIYLSCWVEVSRCTLH